MLRHSEAENVELSLTYTDGILHLAIIDDGCGFDVEAVGRDGLGLTTMRERAEAVAGELRIESEPGRTQVTIEVEAEIARRTGTPNDGDGE